jgi:hypothetical protein
MKLFELQDQTTLAQERKEERQKIRKKEEEENIYNWIKLLTEEIVENSWKYQKHTKNLQQTEANNPTPKPK